MKREGEVVSRNEIGDLYVRRRGKIIQIYELKTVMLQQYLYTAIGQLLSHSFQDIQSIDKVLVVPVDETIPTDVAAVLSHLDISVIRFSRKGSKHCAELKIHV